MAFLHLVKVARDVLDDKRQIGTRVSEAKLLKVYLNGLHDLHDISTFGYYECEKNYYNRKGIFQNKDKSSEIDNKTHM